MKQGVWAAVLLGSLGVGCVNKGVAPGSAFVHPEFPYSVTYDDAATQSVLGDEWRLETYRRVEKTAMTPATLERKEGFEETYQFDFDDDDKKDAEATLPFPDLVFVNNRTDARIEVSTLLLDKRLGNKELRVLLSNMVDSEAGTRSLFIGFGRAAVGVEKRFATRLLDSGPATLEKQTGLVATLERADVDQLELDPKARWNRSRIFLVHAPFDYYATKSGYGAQQKEYHKYRVLLMVEYMNRPEDFEAQYPEFLRLLGKLHLLSDTMLLEYLAEPLASCKKDQAAKLALTISSLGEVSSIDDSSGMEAYCASNVVKSFRFAATSETRRVEHSYDFGKPLKPAWLTQSSYVEERQAPGETPSTPPAEPKPADAPPGDAAAAPTTPPV
jgi:hypothetical protein